jgi:hypothetical protein
MKRIDLFNLAGNDSQSQDRSRISETLSDRCITSSLLNITICTTHTSRPIIFVEGVGHLHSLHHALLLVEDNVLESRPSEWDYLAAELVLGRLLEKVDMWLLEGIRDVSCVLFEPVIISSIL